MRPRAPRVALRPRHGRGALRGAAPGGVAAAAGGAGALGHGTLGGAAEAPWMHRGNPGDGRVHLEKMMENMMEHGGKTLRSMEKIGWNIVRHSDLNYENYGKIGQQGMENCDLSYESRGGFSDLA